MCQALEQSLTRHAGWIFSMGDASAHLIQHMLRHEDRHHRRDAQRDRIARSAVDLKNLAIPANEDSREERVVFEIVDLDALDGSAELLDHVRQQVVREWAGTHL